MQVAAPTPHAAGRFLAVGPDAAKFWQLKHWVKVDWDLFRLTTGILFFHL
jgi:hypothetical protein